MIQRLHQEAKSKPTREKQGRKRSSRVAGDRIWPRARTARRVWVWNSDHAGARLPTVRGDIEVQPSALSKRRIVRTRNPTRMLGAGIWAAPSLSRSAEAFGTPRLGVFLSCSSSMGVHNTVQRSSCTTARGRAVRGGFCVGGGTVRSRSGGGPGRACSSGSNQENPRNAGRGQTGGRLSAQRR